MHPAKQSPIVATAIVALVSLAGTALAQGDAETGEKVFKKCKACHKIGEGAKNSIGPVLTGVVGRKAGTYPGYSYGKSMRKARETGLEWNEENLDGWLKSPKKFLRKILGTRKAKAKMKFKLKKQDDRDNVIAYLKTFAAPMKPEAAAEEKPVKAAVATPAMATVATDICVENQSGKKLLFVVEAKDGERVLKTLESRQNLCAPEAMADAGGTVGVFQDEDALEGCSRLAKAGKAERLIVYEPFDNCSWAE